MSRQRRADRMARAKAGMRAYPEPDMARRPQKNTDEEIAKAILDCQGVLAAAARRLGVTRRSVSYRVDRSAILQETLAEARETNLDIAEGKLLAAVHKDQQWAIEFLLSTQGRPRGYGKEDPVAARVEVAITLQGIVNELEQSDEWLNASWDAAEDRIAGCVRHVGVDAEDQRGDDRWLVTRPASTPDRPGADESHQGKIED